MRGRTFGTAADHQRDLRADRAFLELVVFDLRLFLQLAVVVNLHPLGLARAIVGDRNERPFVGLELILRDDLQRILRIGMDQVHRDAPALNPDIPASIGIRLVHPRDHGIGGVVAGHADPERRTKGLIMLEVATVREFTGLAIEEDCG